MSLYLVLNAVIIAVPLVLTFAPRVYFFRKIKSLAFSIAVVSGLFVLWDVIASWRGDWIFNEKYIGGIGLLGLPLEEILFFITVPYSCLFLYQTFRTYIKQKPFPYNKYAYGILAILCLSGALVFIERAYTATVLIVSATVFVSAMFCFKDIFASNLYWLYIIACTVLFALFNHVLTSLPVVIYSKNAITGLRIASIPIEDFLYNFSLLSFYLIFYHFAEKKWGRSALQ
ncbi:MAG: lycopene cyclase domain-containing protein [candidate division WOR-3 bacterium]|nr:MAG: lycopene cyclase domain-containing protein [candidate division WOR-3 bacterium]